MYYSSTRTPLTTPCIPGLLVTLTNPLSVSSTALCHDVPSDIVRIASFPTILDCGSHSLSILGIDIDLVN